MTQKKISITTKEKKVSFWSENDEALLYELRWNGINYNLIGLQLGRTPESCEKKYRRTDWQSKSFYNKDKCRLKENVKKGIADKIAETNDKRIISSNYLAEILVDRIESSVESLPNVPKRLYIPPKTKNKQKHSPEDVGLILSDSHIGHHHTFEETGGISEYNMETFEKRVDFMKTATANIVELHSNLYDLPNLHIFCPGDIVAGMPGVGAWSASYINTCIVDQAIKGAESFADMIYYWLTLFENIYFYGVYGNHGRGSNRGVDKDYVNWDFICYKFLEARFANNPRVHFDIPKTWWLKKEVRNHNFLVLHGDEIKGGPSAVEAATEKISSLIGGYPDYTLVGHFHSAGDFSTNFGRVIANGSWVGGDVFSIKSLRKSFKPEQKIFGIHDKRGVTWSYNLDLSIAR